jgi:hypothetical protein
MANYEPFVRSNYFQVRDPEAFRSWCQGLGLEVIGNEDPEHGMLFGFIADDGVPCDRYDEGAGEYVEIDFYAELATHLLDGWIAEVRGIGYEKMRYLDGYTVAVDHAGETIAVNLDDIYKKAREYWGERVHCTACEY